MSAVASLTQFLEVLAALVLAPLYLGWVNACRAWLQNRSAPSLLLPYHGIRKLFHKDAVIATDASPLFRMAPYVVFGAMVAAAAVIPAILVADYWNCRSSPVCTGISCSLYGGTHGYLNPALQAQCNAYCLCQET